MVDCIMISPSQIDQAPNKAAASQQFSLKITDVILLCVLSMFF